jgi:pimeloyl-ACP methyl ester carboxylesterase
VYEFLESMGIDQVALAGHSWGASVALNLAATHPDRVAALALIDGAIVTPSDLGPRPDVRLALTPPKLSAKSLHEILTVVQQGSLGPYWNDDIKDALTPTFALQPDGTWGTRIGFTRHMCVLDAFFDYESERDWNRLQTATWLIVCDATEPWNAVREANLSKLRTPAEVYVQRWGGATHDVPLQWPSLVAGLFDTVWIRAARGATT